jgi:hypothetical protein
MRYVLPALAVDEEELNTVQAKIISSMQPSVMLRKKNLIILLY